MPSVVLRAAEVPYVPMPPLCARTGKPARKTVKLTATKTPWWAWFFAFGGLLGMIVGSQLARRCEVRVPHAGLRGVLRGLTAVGIVFGSLAQLMGVMYVVTEPGIASVVYNVVSLAFLGGCVRAYWMSVCGAKFVDDEHVELTRLHPEFAAALRQVVDARREHERRAALAGWHPDPSGQAAYRWFDGVAWTQHVSGAPAYHG